MKTANWHKTCGCNSKPLVCYIIVLQCTLYSQVHIQEMYNHRAIQLSLLVACFYTAVGVFNLGFLTNFLSHSVIGGFTSGAAVIIGMSQVITSWWSFDVSYSMWRLIVDYQIFMLDVDYQLCILDGDYQIFMLYVDHQVCILDVDYQICILDVNDRICILYVDRQICTSRRKLSNANHIMWTISYDVRWTAEFRLFCELCGVVSGLDLATESHT